MDPTFWRNKKVLITGHTGFKGSWLSLWLQEQKAQVVGLSLPAPTLPNLFSDAEVAKNMVSILGDIRDLDLIQSLLLQHRPEIIIHMAAQPLVRYSYTNPVETYAINVMGTVNLLTAVKQANSCKAVINVTSDKCYENKESIWGYREHDVLGGYDPYSNSKACAELVTTAFRSAYYNNTSLSSQCGLATARAGNVIGGGDWAEDRLIPDIMRSLLNNKEFIIRYPEAVRPWQHVLEPLHGYLQLAERLYQNPSEYGQAWNFGPSESDVKPVSWMAERIVKLWGKVLTSKKEEAQKPHETSYLKLDSSKAKVRLDWSPRWNLTQTLEKTVSWYKAYQAGQNIRKETLAQINNYIQGY